MESYADQVNALVVQRAQDLANGVASYQADANYYLGLYALQTAYYQANLDSPVPGYSANRAATFIQLQTCIKLGASIALPPAPSNPEFYNRGYNYHGGLIYPGIAFIQ